ncbi:MAG TPA: acetyl-CoA carboxylase biotin carboxyl carrier protein [Gemmatimonadaceae bacterium]|nr:acetyl-CoA carboxylase biotin carboxyl carrier protein [Gemmatimonadaceae bacterium]
MIDLRYVKKLIDIIDESTVDSIEISSDKGMKIRISKSPSQRGTVQMAAPVSLPAVMPAPAEARSTPAQGLPAMGAEAEAAPRAAAPAGVEVKSPMVGTFYGAPEPGAKPYVSVGTRVSKGQILCIIEAMKIMNEIESEHAGVVTEILVEDSAPVEYGQVLFRIDPNG